MPNEPTWPGEPKPAEADKLVLQAKLDYLKELAKSEQAEELQRLKQEQEADMASLQAMEDATNDSVAAFHNALLEVSKSAIDRARAGAETVQKAAGAIGGLYTGLLAAAFSVAERPLPPRGLVPAILLGWAIAWSTAYLAYLSNAKPVRKPRPTTDFETGAMRRSIAFIRWTRSGAMNRKYALHVSVVALALGVALLPAPFVDFDPVADETATAPAAPDWPSPPAGTDAELNKILYQAQVGEIAELRAAEEPVAGDGDDSTWWFICGGCLAITLLIPALVEWRRKDESEEDPGDGDDIPAAAETIPAPAPAPPPPPDTGHS